MSIGEAITTIMESDLTDAEKLAAFARALSAMSSELQNVSLGLRELTEQIGVLRDAYDDVRAGALDRKRRAVRP